MVGTEVVQVFLGQDYRLQQLVVVVALLTINVRLILVVPAVVLELINRNVVVPHHVLGQQVCTTQMD
jgi:hypothetical protein